MSEIDDLFERILIEVKTLYRGQSNGVDYVELELLTDSTYESIYKNDILKCLLDELSNLLDYEDEIWITIGEEYPDKWIGKVSLILDDSYNALYEILCHQIELGLIEYNYNLIINIVILFIEFCRQHNEYKLFIQTYSSTNSDISGFIEKIKSKDEILYDKIKNIDNIYDISTFVFKYCYDNRWSKKKRVM